MSEVTERFTREVKEVNKTLGELSPTLKLKRNYLAKEYQDIISEIYFNGDKEYNVLGRIRNGINGILKNLPKF